MPEAGHNTLPLADLHSALGARFGDFAGWQMPLWYEGAVGEHKAVRRAAGVFDISHMGRFRVQGPGVAEKLSALFSRDFSKLDAGSSTYALACNQDGGIVDDLMVYRPAEQRFVVICNAANQASIAPVLAGGLDAAELTDAQPDTVLLAVQGPAAVDMLSALLSRDLAELPRRACTELEVDGRAYFCGRTGYTGEDGLEIMTSVEAGKTLFERLRSEHGCVPCGLAARDSLRLEAALPLHGSDIDESTSPGEAGLGWALDLEHEFTGRDALQNSKGASDRRLTCLVSDGAGVLRSHQPVLHAGEQVSSTSSGGFSPTLDRSIAMAYLPGPSRAVDTQLEVEARGRRIPCHVVKRPFYRSTGSKSALSD